jgi:hypothetical protein
VFGVVLHLLSPLLRPVCAQRRPGFC